MAESEEDRKIAAETHDMDRGFTTHEHVPPITWSHRRKMAFIALHAFIWGSLFAFLVGLFPWPERTIAFIETVYTYFMMGCIGVVFGYLGFTTLPFLGRAR